MIRNKRSIAMILMTAAITLLAACSNPPANNSGTGGDTGNSVDNPVEISIMLPFFTKEPPRSDEAIKKIEQYTNTKLNLTWVPNNGYPEKLNATIASGTTPKILTILDLKSSVIVNSVNSGMFWELGPYLSEYQNLADLNETSLKNTAINGETYGLPRERVLARTGVVLRKDWLDNLGLQEPKTIDDLYNVIKAFAHDDPDKNGADDTMGITEDKSLLIFDQVFGFMGGSNVWKEDGGVLTPAFEDPAYLETLKFVKRLVDEKLLNRDFPIYPNNRDDNINKGVTGIQFNVLDSTLSAGYAELTQTNPEAELTVVSRIEGPGGITKIMGGSGANGAFMIPKTAVKTEAELKQVLAFLDKLCDPQMRELFTWGIENKHYNKTDGKYTFIDKAAYTAEVDPLTQLVFKDYNYLYTEQNQTELGQTVESMWKDNEALATLNPAQALISKTQTERGKDLDKTISDAKVKFILGDIDENGWNEVITQWKDNGGTKVMEELNAEYAKLK